MVPANNGRVQKLRGSHVLAVDWFVKFLTNQQRVQMFTPPHSIGCELAVVKFIYKRNTKENA